MNEIEWHRDAYFGGCAYHAVGAPSVFGDYSPDKFEAECAAWRVGRNGEHGTFATLAEALAAAALAAA